MKRRVKGLQRILKVRDTQKKMKETALQKASNQCFALEHSVTRIKNLQMETMSQSDADNVDMLSARMELIGRLTDAERKMEISIETARQEFARAERQNIAARAVYEGTEKLLNSKQKKMKKLETFKADNRYNLLYSNDNNRKNVQETDR
ncbi:MAG: hypothetical protein Pars2KO_00330 [Parasphingorhabdus sp.]